MARPTAGLAGWLPDPKLAAPVIASSSDDRLVVRRRRAMLGGLAVVLVVVVVASVVVWRGAGASSDCVLPIEARNRPTSIEVDRAGTVYMVDPDSDHSPDHEVILQLPEGNDQTTPIVMPTRDFRGQGDGLAVDLSGSLFFASNNESPQGAVEPQVYRINADVKPVLLETFSYWINDIAAADDAALYLATTNGIRVWRDGTGSQLLVEPRADGYRPTHITIDDAGNLYYIENPDETSDGARVFRLARGSDEPERLPFPDLFYPAGISVTPTGDVYVGDGGPMNEGRNLADGHIRVLRSGTNSATELVGKLADLTASTADVAGNIYLVADRKVTKLDARGKCAT